MATPRTGHYFHLIDTDGPFAGLSARQGIIRGIVRSGTTTTVRCEWFSYLDGELNGRDSFVLLPDGSVEWHNRRTKKVEHYTLKTYSSGAVMRSAGDAHFLRRMTIQRMVLPSLRKGVRS